MHGVGAAEHLVVLAHNLRLVQALSQGASLFELDEELLAGIACRLGNGEAERGEVFDLEGLGVV